MFGARKVNATVIAGGAVIEGLFRAEGTLHVEGRIIGDVEVDGQLSVGPGALIQGSVHAENVTVGGRIEGSLTVAGHLCVLGSGMVGDEVRYGSLEVQRGGTIRGRSEHIGEEDALEVEASETDEIRRSSVMPASSIGQA